MKSEITATEAARRFSDLLNRVRYRGESFTILRGGEPVGRLVPATRAKNLSFRDFMRSFRGLPSPDSAFVKDMEEVIASRSPTPSAPWDS